MAASSSSSAAKIYSLWLHTTAGVRVAKVDLPWPLPGLVLYGGNYYVYSDVQQRYVQQSPYAAQPDLGAAPYSVLSFPSF